MLRKNHVLPPVHAGGLALFLLAAGQPSPSSAEPARGTTGDPEADFNWGLSAVGADKAHAAGFTGKGVKVGVYDSGIDPDHPEFDGRIGGYYNPFTDAEPTATDATGHGTSVASVIAANRDGRGLMGMAYNSTAYLVKLNPEAGDPYAPAAVQYGRAYEYYRRSGVEIVNNSWSFGIASDDQIMSLYGAVAGFSASGGVSVFSTGNSWAEFKDAPQLPAALPLIYPELEDAWLAVTALGPNDERALYAQICGPAAQWCLAAPGGQVALNAGGGYRLDGGMELAVPGGYKETAGTSFAAPTVTAGLAIAREIFPDADMHDLRRLILRTARDIGDPGVDETFGWGKLDIGNVVDAIAPSGRRIFADAAWGRSVAMGQVAAAPFAPALMRATPKSRLWASGDLAAAGTLSSTAGPGARTTSRMLSAGIDLIDLAGLTAGLGVGYTSVDTSDRQLANQASADGFHAFAYGRWQDAGWYARSSAGLSYFRQQHQRRSIPGLAGTVLSRQGPAARSRRPVWGAFAGVEAGRMIDLGSVDAALFARLAGTAEQAAGTSETGAGIFDYTLKAGRSATASAGPGLRLSTTHVLGGWQIMPELELSYARVLGADRFTAETSLLNRQMEATTASLGRDLLNVGLKLDLGIADSGLTASIGYAGAFRKSAQQHRVQLGLTVRF